MQFPMRDLAGHVKCAIAGNSENSGAPVLVTAAGTGDNTEVTGTTIDRQGTAGQSLADSCVLAIGWVAALTNAKTLSFTVNVQESSDNSSWDTAAALLAATVVQTATSSTNFSGVKEVTDTNFSGRKRYVRYNITPNLSHSGTDTCTYSAVAILGGYKVSGDAV